MLSNVPESIKEMPRWHVWNYSREGVKIPLQLDGRPAKSNDPATWGSFEDAVSCSKFYQGVAFELGDGPLVGIDLDNCFDDADQIRPWAIRVLARFDGVAYAEVSPSGRGIKLLTAGRKTAGARCVHKIGEEKQQIECYDHSRFWTVTGDVYSGMREIGNGQAAVDWLCQEFLQSGAPAQQTPAKQLPAPPRGLESPLDIRAAAYVETIPGQTKGNLRNAAFSLSGHLHAMVGELGERLADQEVLDLLRCWNRKNVEPLRDEELLEASVNGRTNGQPRAEKHPQIPLCDSGPIPAYVPPGVPNNVDEPFPEECLKIPGFLGEVIQHNLSTAFYPLPELAVASALALLSSLTGGKVVNDRARTNLFLIGLAPSGGGKDHGRKLNRDILRAAGGDSIVGPERIGSHAGIISAMAEQWNTLFQIDEIQHLAMAMQNRSSPHLVQIASVLMQIYSSADSVWVGDAYGDRSKVKKLNYPHLVLYGTSVPEGFWESLSEDNLKGGLIGRCLVFESPKYVPFQKPNKAAIPDGIIERARAWLNLKTHDGNLAEMAGGSAPLEVLRTEEAETRLNEHTIKISGRRMNEDPIPAAIWSRAAEKTIKLALLFSCSRWDGATVPVIRLDDVNLAIRLNNWVTRKMLRQADRHVAGSEFEQSVNKVRTLLRSRPGEEWLLSEITRQTRWLRQKDRNEILLTLVMTGSVVQGEKPSGGRTATTFLAVD
jgi:hypothetical protein